MLWDVLTCPNAKNEYQSIIDNKDNKYPVTRIIPSILNDIKFHLVHGGDEKLEFLKYI